MGTVQIVDEQDLDSDLEAAIRQTLAKCYPEDAEFFSHSRAWHGSAPSFSVCVLEGRKVIAHLGVVERWVTVGGVPVEVAGIQNVCVLPKYRGQGFCREMMLAAVAEAKQRGIDFGLLFCVAQTVPVYGQYGWERLLDQSVVRLDCDGVKKPLAEGNLPMWAPLGKAAFPLGEIYLEGNDW